MFHQNPALTGEGQGPAPSYIVPKWIYETGGRVHSSPVIADGNVYFGSEDNYWYCLDAIDGSLNWKYKAGWYIGSAGAVVDGKFYTGADDTYVTCLDASDGSLIWKTKVENSPITPNDNYVTCAPNVVNGQLYIGTTNGTVFCLNADTGAVTWSHATGGRIRGTLAYANNKIYAGSSNAIMYCIDATDGTRLWSWNTQRPGETSSNGLGSMDGIYGSACVADGQIYFFSYMGGRYWCLDADTGEPIWLFWQRRQRWNYQQVDPLDIRVGGLHDGDQPANDPLGMRTVAKDWITPAYHDGNLYIMDDTFLMRLDADTGQRYWEPYPGMMLPDYTDYIGNASALGIDPMDKKMNVDIFMGFISYTSPAVADGKVYQGTRERCIYVNDAITGERLSWYETGSRTPSSPAVAYGNVYIGAWDWNFACFEEGGIGAYRNIRTGSHRTQTSITASLSSTTVVEDTPLTITGSVTPSGISDPYWGAPEVIAQFVRPDGSEWEENWHLKSDSYGWYMGDPTYEISFMPDMVGTWKVKVRLHSMAYDPYLPSETTLMTFTVTAASSSSLAAPLHTTSALTMLGILAAPAIVAMPIAAVLYKRKKK
jgi:outer membrane protein assembly factor BamB